VCAGLIGEEEFIQNSTLCTNANIQAFAKCLDCAFQDDGETSDEAVIDAQSELDSYISDCQDAGFSVQSATVTSGAGPTSTGTGAPTQTTAKTTGAKTTDESSTDDSASATDAATCVVASASASDGSTNGSASASGVPCTSAPSASASSQGSNGASLTTVRWGTAMALGIFGFALLA